MSTHQLMAYKRMWEAKVLGTCVLRMELSLPGANVPRSESSIIRKAYYKNNRNRASVLELFKNS